MDEAGGGAMATGDDREGVRDQAADGVGDRQAEPVIDLVMHDCGAMVAVGAWHTCDGVDLQAARGRSKPALTTGGW